jgi:DNA-binding response OmpR family regulator
MYGLLCWLLLFPVYWRGDCLVHFDCGFDWLRSPTGPPSQGNFSNSDGVCEKTGRRHRPRTRAFTRDGKLIPLTSKEYQLLDYFIERPHRALTRHTILDHVWGRSIIVSDRSVDRCVATLRSKVELDASNPQFIHTIRDVGYRFEMP